ncbi:PTS sugar transporter subunit IIA [uncultured Gilliamella sp.]|jgi:Phosphotransferase system, mannose/fructose-specific component IIA|uniref:PTS sugar transporter subunit IIA n=1 Tax=uncultured Gilliamella sp. TaxID=1193505 RepID=UPI0025D3997A|nr:PTS sugar transporter subunit IIA [uncultured Gilliamella sp.]
MQKQLPIILASHGLFAQGALDCAEMLMGRQTDIDVISVKIDSNIEKLRQQMLASYQTLNQGFGVIILVDLMGGTPCNLASELAIQYDDVLLVCGFNIPVLLEVLNNREDSLQNVKNAIKELFSKSCFDVGQHLNNQNEQSTEL